MNSMAKRYLALGSKESQAERRALLSGCVRESYSHLPYCCPDIKILNVAEMLSAQSS